MPMGSEVTDALVAYLVGDDDRLETALHVLAAHEAIVTAVLHEFVADLENEIRRRLQKTDGLDAASWEVGCVDVNGSYSHTTWYLSLHKRSWTEMTVALQPTDARARGFIYGAAYRHEIDPANAPHKVHADLTERIGRGSRNSWWAWWARIEARFDDWGDETTLARLIRRDRRETLEYLAERMLHVALVAEKAIDTASSGSVAQ